MAGPLNLIASAWQSLFWPADGTISATRPAEPLVALAARLRTLAAVIAPGTTVALDAGPGGVAAGLLAALAPQARIVGLVDESPETTASIRYWLREGQMPANLVLKVQPPAGSVTLHPADVPARAPAPVPGVTDRLLVEPGRYPGMNWVAAGLSDMARAVAYWGERGMSIGEIAAEMRIEPDTALAAAGELVDGGHVVAAPVSGGIVRWHGHTTRGVAMLDPADMSLPTLWAMRLAVSADRPVVVGVDGGPITYRGLDRAIRAAMSTLAAARLPKGAIIILQSMPVPEYMVWIWACWHLGLVALPAPATAGPDAVLDLAGRSGAAAIALSPGVDDAPYAGCAFRLFDMGEPASPTHDPIALPEMAPDDAAFIVTTSGTTSAAKLVVHTHRSAITAAKVLSDSLDTREDDVWTSPMTVSEMGGIRNSLISTVWCGAAWLPMPPPEPGHMFRVAERLERFRPTRMFSYPVLPAQLADLAAAGRIVPVNSLRTLYSGGSTVGPAERRRLASTFGCEVVVGFAMSELSPAIRICTAPDHDEGEGLGRTYECLTSIRGGDGQPVPDGTPGQLWLLAEHAMAGYLANGRVDRERFHLGWMLNGDTLRRDADGRHFLMGRGDAWIKRPTGLKVYLSTVIEAIQAMDAVREATALACIDANGTEAIVAFVVVHEPETAAPDIEAALKRGLGGDFVPAAVVMLDALPRNDRDKVSIADLERLVPAPWRPRRG